MKYGIEQGSDKTVCANCKHAVSEFQNYCAECGAPLTPIAIADFEDFKEEVRSALLVDLENIAKERKINTFTDVVKVYKLDN